MARSGRVYGPCYPRETVDWRPRGSGGAESPLSRGWHGRFRCAGVRARVRLLGGRGTKRRMAPMQNIKDRLISPQRGHLWPKQTRPRDSTSNFGSRTGCPGFGGAHTAPKLKSTAGLLCYNGDCGQIRGRYLQFWSHFGLRFDRRIKYQ